MSYLRASSRVSSIWEQRNASSPLLSRCSPRLIFQFTTRMESGGMRTNRDGEKLPVSISCIEIAACHTFQCTHLDGLEPRNRWPITRGSKQTCGVFTRWFCILREIRAVVHHLALGPGKSEGGVQRDRPNQICSNHAQSARHAHEIKERKDEQGIREKTAPDDELRMSGEKQERIRRPALSVALPDFQ